MLCHMIQTLTQDEVTYQMSVPISHPITHSQDYGQDPTQFGQMGRSLLNQYQAPRTLTVSVAVLNSARMMLPVREAGANRGRFVEAIIRYAGGLPGEPWCASFVYYVGHKMLGGLGWRLPKTRSCDVLLEHARAQGTLYDEEVRPEPGWLFLVMQSDKDATHVGFVDVVLPDGRFTTIEGNSNDRGVRDGDGVVANTRDPKGPTRYAYIDWPSLTR